MRKVALHNLGCKVNSYETEAMQQQLERDGYEIVPFSEFADIYIVNTCTVTNIADRKSRQMLHRAKKKNSQGVVIAVGCYVQAAGEELLKDAAVDIIIGNNQKKDLPAIIKAYFDEENLNQVTDISCESSYEELSIEKTAQHSRVFIKIQDGCNQFCSYCIIPFARGRVRSRRPEDIIREVSGLASRGYQEVVLTGIHLSSYGVDFKTEKETLLSLIGKMNEIDGIKRIRLGSLEPLIITETLVRSLAAMEKFCPHFHLSLQSGSNETLKRMNRRYTKEEYYDKCRLIRKYFTNPAITTDIIVGFPQETDEEFQETMKFVEGIAFAEIHVFKYSKREGTKAAAMNGQVAEAIKAERSSRLIKLGESMAAAYKESLIGKYADVLLEEEEEIEGRKYLVGHTMEYVKVALPAQMSGPGRSEKILIKTPVSQEFMLCEKIELEEWQELY